MILTIFIIGKPNKCFLTIFSVPDLLNWSSSKFHLKFFALGISELQKAS